MIKEYEIKTNLTEDQYLAMQEVTEALGMTHAGYLRHLVILNVCASQELVSQMKVIRSRRENGRKPAGIRAV